MAVKVAPAPNDPPSPSRATPRTADAAVAIASATVSASVDALGTLQQNAQNALKDATELVSIWDTSNLADSEAGPAGVLVFTIHRGTDLMSADTNGLSDPYCIVKVYSSPVWRSRVIKKTLNPVWEQSHEFEGYMEDQTRKPIKIRVYDFDVTSLNDPIGTCLVDISALKMHGAEHGLTFEDVPLEGVPHGKISFDVHFEVKPVFALFPGTPLHASAAQALHRRPPTDASLLELCRDGVLRVLSRKIFLYLAVLWLTLLILSIILVAVLYCGLLFPVFANAGNMTTDPVVIEYAPWSREARFIGLSDSELMYWCNVCFQLLTALFSYLNGIATPWRVSILMHHLSRRSSAPGFDFYGRPTEAIWFHIPERPRAVIATCLCGSVFFHFATQATRLIWTDYISSNLMPGLVPVNVTFVLSIVFAIAAGAIQGAQEKKLKKAHPERYPPGIDQHLKEFYQRWKRGEIRKLCSLHTLRELMRESKEAKANHFVASSLKRIKQPDAPSASPPQPQCGSDGLEAPAAAAVDMRGS